MIVTLPVVVMVIVCQCWIVLGSLAGAVEG